MLILTDFNIKTLIFWERYKWTLYAETEIPIFLEDFIIEKVVLFRLAEYLIDWEIIGLGKAIN